MKNNDGELFRLGCLVCKLPGGLLAKVARSKFKRELEILNRNTFTQSKESMLNLLCKREGELSRVLKCHQTQQAIKSTHLLPTPEVWERFEQNCGF